MTHKAKAQEMKQIADRLWEMMQDGASFRNDLEEIGCAADAKRLDTIVGKLYDLSLKLQDKAQK